MNRMGIFVRVVGTFALALGLAAAMPAQAQNQCTTTTFDLTGAEVFNPCNDESVVLTSGTNTITQCSNDDKHASFSLALRATGMGDQGNTYVLEAHASQRETVNAKIEAEGGIRWIRYDWPSSAAAVWPGFI